MTNQNKASRRGASRYESDDADARAPVPGWVWLVAGIVVGGFIMFLVNLEPGNKDVLRNDDSTAQPVQPVRPPTLPDNANHTASTAGTTGQPANPAETGNKSKFDFYTMLPGSEVVVPPEAVPEKAPPQPTPEQIRTADAARAQAILDGKTPPPPLTKTPATQFFLQAGSFPTRDRAESVRAHITLLGQSVRVESGNVADKTWYRVMVGPFASRDQVTRAQQQLSSNGFNNLLMQQKTN